MTIWIHGKNLRKKHYLQLKISKLNKTDISTDDYEHDKNVWAEHKCRNMRDYHDLYLKSDTLLLAVVFEEFRSTCINNYKLDPCQYYTAPGLSWDAALMHSKQRLELLTDENMHFMVEKGLRGGISQISKRHAEVGGTMKA